MLDFDKLFEEYLIKWYEQHRDIYERIDDLENNLPELYNNWTNTPSKELNGVSPREFFNNIKDHKELLKKLIEMSEGALNPSALLIERISNSPECIDGLREIARGNYSVAQKMLAVNLLQELSAEPIYDLYIDWILDKNADEGLKEVASEILSLHPDNALEKIKKLMNKADDVAKIYFADILIRAKPCDFVYEFLLDMFVRRVEVPLFAAYLGKYGDERCIKELYKALDNCNYLEYLEIRNAIEMLGGNVDDEGGRDFSDDPYYKAIKNVK